MPPTTPTPITYSTEVFNASAGDGLATLAAFAADNQVAAIVPVALGDHAVAIRKPAGWSVEIIDVADYEDDPRSRLGVFKFATVASIVNYVNRYGTDQQTQGYVSDVTGHGPAVLTADTMVCEYVLDDFDPDHEAIIANRTHLAQLTLRPTTAARRWGRALGPILTQEQMVELVIDGVGEIADPPAADLRDLISDLHAIRTSSAKSIVSTTGGLAVELAENATLHAGPGHIVQVPEELTLVLQPWTAVSATITTKVKIRPKVNDGRVGFQLSAPHLEDALNTVLQAIHADLGASQARGTGIEPYWIA